jgi:eukaryotic-like serine/threonine-protein kinase
MAPTVAVAHAAATQHLPTTTEATRAVAAGGFVSRRARTLATGQVDAVDAPATGQFAAQPEPRRGSRVFMTLLVLLLLVVLGLVGWLTWRAYQESSMVTVPVLVGETQQSAETRLSAEGLSVSGVTQRADSAAAGTVIASDPEAGARVDAKSAVALVVSTGPAAVAVPDVTGRTESQAKQDLEAEGLIEGTVSPQDSPLPQGTVMASDPAAGTQVQPGTAVNLVIASGKVALTDQSGKSQEAAQAALTELGLSPSYTVEPSDAPVGQIIRQSPATGSVAVGSIVQLVVSGGPTATASPTDPPTGEPTDQPTDGAAGGGQSPSQSPSASQTPSTTPTQGTSLAPEEPADGEPSRSPRDG